MPQVFQDVACTVCGCVCDDLEVTVEGGKVIGTERACFLAEPWFLEQDSKQPPAAQIAGAAVAWDKALDQAAEILQQARSPLIYGLSRSSTEGQRAAVRLADQLGATIDTTASTCHAPSIMAIQEVGESTCSLGEVKNRADLVIFWGANPARSHPRHMERYSSEPVGMFLPNGRSDRTVVVIDVEPNETSELADLFIQVEPGQDFETVWTLRCLLRGLPPEPDRSTGASLPALRDLVQRMRSCRCGVVFFGLGLSRTGAAHRNVEALLRLVTDLNAYTRFHAKRMRIPGDVTGADSALCWQTGFPFSVSLSRGYPRYNPGEYSANEMLERDEVDACLFVGSEGIRQFSPAAVANLRKLPTVMLDHPTVESALPPTVRFTTAVYGVHLPGTAYRMDEVPIPLGAFLPQHFPSDKEVLDGIAERVALKGPG